MSEISGKAKHILALCSGDKRNHHIATNRQGKEQKRNQGNFNDSTCRFN